MLKTGEAGGSDLMAFAQDRTRQLVISTSSHAVSVDFKQMPSSAESMSQLLIRVPCPPVTSIPSLFPKRLAANRQISQCKIFTVGVVLHPASRITKRDVFNRHVFAMCNANQQRTKRFVRPTLRVSR